MQSVFPEWYGPSKGEIGDFVSSAIIALDANVLLALYRVNKTQRDELLRVLNEVSPRVWVPYQAALEYQRRRLSVASGLQKVYDGIELSGTVKFDEFVEDLVAKMKALGDSAVNGLQDRDIRNAVTESFDRAASEIVRTANAEKARIVGLIHELRELHAIDFSTVRESDPIRAALDLLLGEGKVGPAPSPETLAERKEKALERIEKKIPPGYKDADKPDPTGDCLIWFEILDKAKSADRPILFVTDDAKEDFYERVHGETVGPRVELRQEMLEVTGHRYHQIPLAGFLRLANEYLKAEIPEDTILQYNSRPVEVSLSAEEVSPTVHEDRDLLIEDAVDDDPLEAYDLNQFRIADELEEELARIRDERRRSRLYPMYEKKFNDRRNLGVGMSLGGNALEAENQLRTLLKEETSIFGSADLRTSALTRMELIKLYKRHGRKKLAAAQGAELHRDVVNQFGAASASARRIRKEIAEVLAG